MGGIESSSFTAHWIYPLAFVCIEMKRRMTKATIKGGSVRAVNIYKYLFDLSILFPSIDSRIGHVVNVVHAVLQANILTTTHYQFFFSFLFFYSSFLFAFILSKSNAFVVLFEVACSCARRMVKKWFCLLEIYSEQRHGSVSFGPVQDKRFKHL